jgi:hypothetical protein
VDSLVYDYNIRGWLTGINKNYLAGTTNHYFGMELAYDKQTSVAPGNTYVIHNHPWTNQWTDLKFSQNIPLVVVTQFYDRDIMSVEEYENITFYLYTPDGNLWANRGLDPEDPYSNPNRHDEIIAKYLPWDPDTIVNNKKLGLYNKKWQWTK